MARGISLRLRMSQYIAGQTDGTRVRLDATACDMTAKVFAYRQYPKSPVDGGQSLTYSHVCSPVDLEEYPEDAPNAGSQPAWCRLTYVDVLLASKHEANEFVALVKAHVVRLIDTLNIMDELEPGATYEIGATCPTDSSSASAADADEDAEPAASYGELLELSAFSSLEQRLGPGAEWSDVSAGAGSPIEGGDPIDYSMIGLIAGQTSQALVLQGFDFADLPADALIEGFELELRLAWHLPPDSLDSLGDDTDGCPAIWLLSLMHPDTGLGDNQTPTPQCLDIDGYETLHYGGDEDLLGMDLTAAQVKQGNFGAILVLILGAQRDEAQVRVDGARITVHYRELL